MRVQHKAANGKHKADPGASDYAMGAGDAGGGNGGNQYSDLNPFHRRIMEAVAAHDNEEGMHVTQLVRQIGGDGEEIMWVDKGWRGVRQAGS